MSVIAGTNLKRGGMWHFIRWGGSSAIAIPCILALKMAASDTASCGTYRHDWPCLQHASGASEITTACKFAAVLHEVRHVIRRAAGSDSETHWRALRGDH